MTRRSVLKALVGLPVAAVAGVRELLGKSTVPDPQPCLEIVPPIEGVDPTLDDLGRKFRDKGIMDATYWQGGVCFDDHPRIVTTPAIRNAYLRAVQNESRWLREPEEILIDNIVDAQYCGIVVVQDPLVPPGMLYGLQCPEGKLQEFIRYLQKSGQVLNV